MVVWGNCLPGFVLERQPQGRPDIPPVASKLVRPNDRPLRSKCDPPLTLLWPNGDNSPEGSITRQGRAELTMLFVTIWQSRTSKALTDLDNYVKSLQKTKYSHAELKHLSGQCC